MMTLTIELPPEMERRLQEAAARHGQAPAEFVRAAVEEKLAGSPDVTQREAQLQRNQAALALLRQWRLEDAENPDPAPLPSIPPLSLREVRID
jgi:predicted DNA-binding protein